MNIIFESYKKQRENTTDIFETSFLGYLQHHENILELVF